MKQLSSVKRMNSRSSGAIPFTDYQTLNGLGKLGVAWMHRWARNANFSGGPFLVSRTGDSGLTEIVVKASEMSPQGTQKRRG